MTESQFDVAKVVYPCLAKYGRVAVINPHDNLEDVCPFFENVLRVIVFLEEYYKVDLPPESLVGMRTVHDLVTIFHDALNRRHSGQV